MDDLKNLYRKECPLPLMNNGQYTLDVKTWISEFEDYIKLEKIINPDEAIDEFKSIIILIGKEARQKLEFDTKTTYAKIKKTVLSWRSVNILEERAILFQMRQKSNQSIEEYAHWLTLQANRCDFTGACEAIRDHIFLTCPQRLSTFTH
ncbi:hypothetical protein A3Q56_06560 [Intoshia linei]|uniref:Uncharacterized protein n=1 Tax=Intoshia linei TaxID=1819745 RepID=A0A177AUJ5_9BILA|nr:hypothetical protein A3Q56_06560 [Intoshia linei]